VKHGNTSATGKNIGALAEMELERRAFVRDKLIDRILSASAIVISVVALMLRF
jgi:hypothetical protein